MNNNYNNYGFRFRNWDIYKDAREFRIEVNKLLKEYPKEEKYALIDQTKRALNSIVLNIAEGSSKNSDKDARVYINRSHCSLDEVVACLDCAFDDKYIIGEQHNIFLLKASSLAKRLNSFTNYLNRQMSEIKNQRLVKGIASLPTIMVIAILILAIGVGITALALNESIMSAAQFQSSKALFYAEAGARDALIKIARNKNYTCASPSTGCYQIDFATSGCSTSEGCAKITVSAATSPKVIVSEGRVNNNVRKVQVDVYFDASLNGEIVNTKWQEIAD